MPLYDYDCAACGRRFEVIHGVHADPPEACPLCGKGPVRKAITAATVHYKGSGWAKKERRAAVKSASRGGDDASRGGDDSSEAGPPASESTSSSSESGSTAAESGSSSTNGSRPAVPASGAAGDTSTGPSRPSKTSPSSKPPARTSD